jgi:predicted RNase H-like nuclease (RuvC/YqgF family)
MDTHLNQMKDILKTNEELILSQRREINKLEAQNESLTNRVVQSQQSAEMLQTRLKEACEGVKKQNEALKELVAQRDEFVQKLNDSVKERNAIVEKYNALVSHLEKPGGNFKASEK